MSLGVGELKVRSGACQLAHADLQYDRAVTDTRIRYEVVLPTGELRRGYLDQDGFARIDAIPDGQCQVSFPDYDYSSWDAA